MSTLRGTSINKSLSLLGNSAIWWVAGRAAVPIDFVLGIGMVHSTVPSPKL